jgi:DNA-directed RNA polymerase subunit M/transcription elongation factor TFIIS
MIVMDFCPECGSLLQVSKKGAIHLGCPKCKYKTELNQHKIKSNNVACIKSKEIAVIDKNTAALRQLSTVNVVCQTCGHNHSETWQVEAANETVHSTVTFFRCIKCGTTRRENG